MDVEPFFGSLDAELAKMFRYWNIDVIPETKVLYTIYHGILDMHNFQESKFYQLQKTELNVGSLEELYHHCFVKYGKKIRSKSKRGRPRKNL